MSLSLECSLCCGTHTGVSETCCRPSLMESLCCCAATTVVITLIIHTASKTKAHAASKMTHFHVHAFHFESTSTFTHALQYVAVYAYICDYSEGALSHAHTLRTLNIRHLEYIAGIKTTACGDINGNKGLCFRVFFGFDGWYLKISVSEAGRESSAV